MNENKVTVTQGLNKESPPDSACFSFHHLSRAYFFERVWQPAGRSEEIQRAFSECVRKCERLCLSLDILIHYVQCTFVGPLLHYAFVKPCMRCFSACACGIVADLECVWLRFFSCSRFKRVKYTHIRAFGLSLCHESHDRESLRGCERNEGGQGCRLLAYVPTETEGLYRWILTLGKGFSFDRHHRDSCRGLQRSFWPRGLRCKRCVPGKSPWVLIWCCFQAIGSWAYRERWPLQ